MEAVQVNEAKAVQKYLRVAPRKVRLVADLVRGMKVDKALVQLQFTNKKPADLVAKVIKSAAANYRDKYETNIDNSELIIKSITVDSGSMLKRIQPAPQGRAHLIRKRSSHINVIVAPVETDNQETEG